MYKIFTRLDSFELHLQLQFGDLESKTNIKQKPVVDVVHAKQAWNGYHGVGCIVQTTDCEPSHPQQF